MRTLAVLAVCLFAFPAIADEPLPQGPEGDVIKAANTLQLSKDPAELDRAELTLKLHADRAAHRLDSIAKFRPAVKDRVERIRQFVGGGEVVDGLRVRLSLDKQAIRPGDTVHITTTLMNLTDKPMQLEVGYTTSGNYFEAGSAFVNSFTTGSTGQAAPLKPASMLIGVCGTGAHAIVKTIEPMATLSYTAPLTYGMTKLPPQRPVKPGEQPAQVKALKFAKNMFQFFPVETNGTVSFTVQRTNRDIRPKPQPKPAKIQPKPGNGPEGIVRIQPAPVFIQPGWPQAKIDAEKPFWHGSMKSNTVELKVFTEQVG